MKNKEGLYVLLLILLILTPFAWVCSTTEPTPATEYEETESIIKWKQEEITVVPVEPDVPETTNPPYTGIKFYDVPMNKDLQMHLLNLCDGYNIAPSLVLAMIERESNYDATAIGDDGDSFGLMQIQPRWWQWLMDELGCDDLMDPYQNITVGVAIIDYFRDKNPDIYWVLMNYNMSPKKAQELWNEEKYSEYAVEVVESASEIAEDYETGGIIWQ